MLLQVPVNFIVAYIGIQQHFLCNNTRYGSLAVLITDQDGKRWSLETEHRSEKKSRLLVLSVFLTNNCQCWGLVAKRWLHPCNVRTGPYALGLWWASFLHMTARLKMHGECSWNVSMTVMLIGCCHSFSPMAQPAGTKLLQRHSQIVTAASE